VHNITWSVTDSSGATDGIGSRFFTMANESSPPACCDEARRPERIPFGLDPELVDLFMLFL